MVSLQATTIKIGTPIRCRVFVDLQFSTRFLFYTNMFRKNIQAEICKLLRKVQEYT